MSDRIQVLIVDDSAFVRKALGLMLKGRDDIEVIGEAADGQEAVEKAIELEPDVITMDLEMPKMDGFDAIKEIRNRGVMSPILVVSALAQEAAEMTVRALQLGAADVIPKPSKTASLSIQDIEYELLMKVRAVGGSQASSIIAKTKPAPRIKTVPSSAKVKIVLIGSSTGGPNILTSILADIPADFPVPIVVAQHMPEVFTATFARRLANVCPIGTRELQGGEMLPGKPTVYLGKGQRHILLRKRGDGARVELTTDPMGMLSFPSVTFLFKSAGESLGAEHILGIVLTGMGEDAKEGAVELHDAGARILVQDKATSVVWGMPASVLKAGAADEVLPATEMAAAIVRNVT